MKQGEFMFAELRKQEIVNIVQAGGKTTVGELCAHFSVSPATIRNDLSELEQIGSLKRTHGGAICNDNAANYEPTSCEKEVQNVDSKKAIAMAAIKFVHQGDIIALDTGTTTLEFAMRLATLSGLTIITTDLKIATYLEQNSDHTVILIGGVIRKNFHCTTGKMVNDTLNMLHIDKLFLATNGIDLERGLSTPNIEMASIKQKMIQISSQIILLADSSKINKNSFTCFASLDEIDVFVTDRCNDSAFLEKADACGITVVAANSD